MGLLSLMARLGMNTSGFELGAKRAEGVAHKLGHTFEHELKHKLAAVFSVIAVEQAIERTGEWAHALHNLSERTGMSLDTLQRWGYAAERTGVDLSSLTNAAEKLGAAQAKAINDPEMFATLQRLGLTDEQIRDTADFAHNFELIAAHLKDAEFTGQTFADILATMGKSGRDVLPAIRRGLKEAGDELERIGGIASDEAIIKMAASVERFKQIWIEIRPIVAGIASTLSTFFQDAVYGIKEIYASAMISIPAIARAIAAAKRGHFSEAGEILMQGSEDANEAVAAINEKREAAREALHEHHKPLGHYDDEGEKEKKDTVAEQAAKARERAEERILVLNEEIADIKRKTGEIGMNEADKRADKEKHILDLAKQIAEMKADGALATAEGELAVSEQEKKLAQAQQDLAQFNFQNIDKADATPMQVDALSRIGGLGVNSDNSAGLRTPLERIARASEETARNTEGAGRPLL